MTNRNYVPKKWWEDERPEHDHGLMSGLRHAEWKERGESKDEHRYGVSGRMKESEKKHLHKITI